MKEEFENLVFPDKGNILGTVKFKFPEEGKYSASYFGRNKAFTVKFKNLLNEQQNPFKRVKLIMNKNLDLNGNRLSSGIITIKKESYNKTNNLYIKVYSGLKFIGFIHVIKGEG